MLNEAKKHAVRKAANQTNRRGFRAYGVKVAYLFGSHAKEAALPISDIDIAVLFGSDIEKGLYFERSINLAADLIKALERNDVDVAVLNTASPLLRYKVFADGVLVLGDNEKAA